MARATGIELCPDSCLLVGTRSLRGGDAEILALRRLEGPYWPTLAPLITQSLQTVRQDARLPRRAFVVAWEFEPRGSDRPKPDVLKSIEAAGFQIGAVLTPPEALQRLAISRQRTSPDTAIAWLALNKCGAALGIVRGRDLLFSRSFPWIYKDDLKTGKAQALQRYSLVAHLAPEITHGMRVVQAEHGLQVAMIVTCGDLPDLRSLTMPLIEELDLEVETLDSADGLQLTKAATGPAVAESAPALRLVTAAALASAAETRSESVVPVLLRIAAVIALLAIGGIGYLQWSASAARSNSAAVTDDPAPQPIATQGKREPNRATTPDSTAPGTRSQQSDSSLTDRRTGGAPPAPLPPAPPLREPLPRVDTVLIDQDRHLALVEGGVVAVGDAIGSRVVVGIERDGVVLREPSGRLVKVRVRAGAKS